LLSSLFNFIPVNNCFFVDREEISGKTGKRRRETATLASEPCRNLCPGHQALGFSSFHMQGTANHRLFNLVFFLLLFFCFLCFTN
jgi:hypothetical protein